MESLSPPRIGSRPVEQRFQRWYAEHFNYVWRSLLRLGAREADLGDLSHDVFIILWKQRDRLDPERPLRPWLFGVAFRVASNHRRLAWFKRAQPTAELHPEDPDINPEQRTIVRAELRLLEQAIRQVPLRHRAVMLLHDFDEIAMAEVADSLGIPVKTAYSRLAAARKTFRRVFRQLQLDEDHELRRLSPALGELR